MIKKSVLPFVAFVGAAAPAAGQADLMICVIPDSSSSENMWDIVARFQTTPPNDIVQIWADASFRLTGDGVSPITITSYDSSYDTTLGDARVTNGTTATFIGNSNSFFGTPNATNPLTVASFQYDGFAPIQIELFGQNSALFDDGTPFGQVELYLDAQGNPGTLNFNTFWFPSPGTAAVLGCAGLLGARRRRASARI